MKKAEIEAFDAFGVIESLYFFCSKEVYVLFYQYHKHLLLNNICIIIKLSVSVTESESGKEVKKEQRLLSRHRRGLLDDLHACQKRIDCLDYLIYQIEKKKYERG